MIREFTLENCGPLTTVQWNVSPGINIVIGKNGTGKTLLLKMLYTVLRSTESFQRGDDTRSFREILGEKLRGTYQLEHVGHLVRKGSNVLQFKCQIDEQEIAFSFSSSAERGVGKLSSAVPASKESWSLFLPAKEVLSLSSVIKKSRLQDQIWGFDDTYLDLAIALEGVPRKGKQFQTLAKARSELSDLFQGHLAYEQGNWVFKHGNIKYPIYITAEGIKRLALLDWVIRNRTLTRGSTLFVDEPESALHPHAVRAFMEILYTLAREQIQIFLATHSYFVVKSLYVIAKREKANIQILSLTDQGSYTVSNIAEGLPENSIIDEAIALYEQELDVEMM